MVDRPCSGSPATAYQHLCLALAGPAKNPKALFGLLPCSTPNASQSVFGCSREIIHMPCDAKDENSCRPSWLRLEPQLFDALRTSLAHGRRERGVWLVLLGDSDTRGLAFSLLQMLAEAVNGRARAAVDKALWLGVNTTVDTANATKANVGSRVCHLDWQWNARGGIVAQRSLPCKESRMPDEDDRRSVASAADLIAAQIAVGRSRGYPMLGEQYNLSSLAEGARLRGLIMQ